MPDSHDGSDIIISLTDVYGAVKDLAAKVSREATAAEVWRHHHEVQDLEAFAQINTRLAFIESKLTAVDVALATQDSNVTLALARVNDARDKAEQAVDKPFEKVDAIGSELEDYASSGRGRLAGSQSVQMLVFALAGVIGVAAGIIINLIG